MNKALVKANDELISFCKCDKDAFAAEGQADCPWCGCGWLFTCVNCGLAFTFAQVVETEVSPQEIIQRDFSRRSGEQVSLDDEDVLEQAAWYTKELAALPVGALCAYLDGKILSVTDADIEFDGWFAHHKLAEVPQAAADGSRENILKRLGDKNYWLERELEGRDDS